MSLNNCIMLIIYLVVFRRFNTECEYIGKVIQKVIINKNNQTKFNIDENKLCIKISLRSGKMKFKFVSLLKKLVSFKI